jgi:hypothetical protein
MALATYQISAFFGGEWGAFAQGRTDRPDYKYAMSVCLNGIPIELGTWVRRPGTRWVAQTFGGAQSVLFSFSFQDALPYTIELSSLATCRFIAPTNSTIGLGLVGTNDPQTIVSISTANPAVVRTASAHGWSTGDHVLIPGAAYLQYREFVITVVDTTHFSIADQVTGAGIDGSQIGALPAGTQALHVLQLGSPYTAPGTADGIDKVRKVQAETTAILLHPTVQTYALTTTNDPGTAIPAPAGTFFEFALDPATFLDGPYLDQYVGTTLTPSGTSGSITLTSGGAAFVGFQPADVGRLIRVFSQPPQWNVSTPYAEGAIVSVMVDPVNQPGVATYWAALVSGTGAFPPLSPLSWTSAVNGLAGVNSAASFTGIATGATPTSASGVGAGGVLPTSQAGGNIATWSWGTITAVNASNEVTVAINGNTLVNTDVIYAWRMGAYGGANGYPTCGVYDGDRLWLGGAIGNRVDACMAGGINGSIINFAPTNADGTVGAANGISAVFSADDVNTVEWMAHQQQGIICGTQGGEWLVFAPTPGGIAPNNIDAKRVTQIGGANVEVRYAEHTLIFVQRYGRKVIEFFADVFSGRLSGPNLSLLWKHLTKGGIQDLAYQQELSPNIWMRVPPNQYTASGLIGCSYKRETLASSQGPTMAGAHRHVLGSGRVVESISVGPSAIGTTDALMMITNNPATPSRQIEVMTDILDEGSTLLDAQYVDNAIAPIISQALPTTAMPYGGLNMSGLWPLNGQTISVWAGGLDCGDYQVINGVITVPYGDGISAGTAKGLFTQSYVASIPSIPIWCGFTYTSQGQLVRPDAPAQSGSRNGPAFGKYRRNHYIMAQVEGAVSSSIWLGTAFNKLMPLKFTQANPPIELPPTAQTTGVFRMQPTDGDTFDGQICWQIKRPHPGNIVSIGGALDTKDV